MPRITRRLKQQLSRTIVPKRPSDASLCCDSPPCFGDFGGQRLLRPSCSRCTPKQQRGCGFLKPAVGQQITEKGLLRSSDPDSSREDDEITTKTLWTCQTEEASEDHQVHQYEMRTGDYATTIRQLACCFVDCASRDSGLFERLNRYETALWRQALQIIWLLRPLRQG
jgi:hypothetical protein